MSKSTLTALAACAALWSGVAMGQTPPSTFNGHASVDMTATTVAPLDIKQIPLGAVGSAGSENWESLPGDLIVRNTTQPSLYLVAPKPGAANGAAIILAPGGGFVVQSMGNEGLDVAKTLTGLGYTCFILKYRLNPSPKDPSFLAEGMAKMAAAAPKNNEQGPPPSPAQALAGADGLAAVAYVRAHAAEYGVDPHRVGMVGFSAGGAVTLHVASSYDVASRPDFVGSIYGPPPPGPVRADAPPVFVAVAADDPLLGKASLKTFEAWREAGRSAELHVYTKGGHGFGAKTQGTTSDLWLDEFTAWLKFQGVAGAAAK
jgi:acetyl esterase/lipase